MSGFLKKLCIYILPFFVFFSVPCFIYYSSSEHLSIHKIYTHQKKNTDILSSKAYSNNQNISAFYNIVQQRPEMLILGSSRVNNLRPEDFGNSCYNANTNGISMDYYYSFLKNLEANNALPKILLFGPDQWFFNPHSTYEYNINKDISTYLFYARKTIHITPYAIKQIWLDLCIHKKIHILKIFSSKHIGLSAKQHNLGWNFRGSPYDKDFIPLNKSSYVDEYHKIY